MSIDAHIVKKIARLARIAISEGDVPLYSGELTAILNWVEQLQEVNTEEVEPLGAVIFSELVKREDIVESVDQRQELLKSAPHSKYGCYVVPQVID